MKLLLEKQRDEIERSDKISQEIKQEIYILQKEVLFLIIKIFNKKDGIK